MLIYAILVFETVQQNRWSGTRANLSNAATARSTSRPRDAAAAAAGWVLCRWQVRPWCRSAPPTTIAACMVSILAGAQRARAAAAAAGAGWNHKRRRHTAKTHPTSSEASQQQAAAPTQQAGSTGACQRIPCSHASHSCTHTKAPPVVGILHPHTHIAPTLHCVLHCNAVGRLPAAGAAPLQCARAWMHRW